MRGLLTVSLAVVSFALQGCGGCGDDGGGRLPDAPPLIDAAADAPDAMIAEVTLTVTRLGEPNPGVRVYFLAPDDTLIKMADTDAQGVATAVMPVGGSVTAINPFDAPPQPALATGGVRVEELRTFLGVKPGDHLTLNQSAFDSISFVVNISAVEGANTYELFTTCGTSSINPGGGSGAEVFLANCNGAADVAVRTSNQGEGIEYISGLYHPDATLMNSQPLDLTGDTYQDLTSINITYTNAPDTSIELFHGPIAKHGVMGPFQASVNGSEATIPEPTLTGVTKAIFATSLSTSTNEHNVIDWGAFTTSYALDFNNLLLREITSEPAFDKATGKLAWAEADVGAAPDMTVSGVLLSRQEPTNALWHWELAQAGSTSEIKLPRLPTDVFDWTPVESDSVVAIDPVTNYKLPGGYDAVRPRIFSLHDEGSPATIITGESGRAQRVQWRPVEVGEATARRPLFGLRAPRR